MTRWIRLALGAVLLLATPLALGNAFFGSNPQTGSLTWSGFSNGSASVNITGGIFGTVNAGQFYGFFDPTAEGDGAGYEADDFFRFFCIDINHAVDSSATTYTRDIGIPDATNAEQLARLFDLFYPNKTVGTYYSGGETTFGSVLDANASAAFQLAVWDIWFDDGTNISTGPFSASGNATVTALAQTYLDAVNAGSGTPPGWTFYTFTNPSYQSYLSAEYSTPLRTTPEPGTLVLLCSAVLAAWAAALRRRQTA